MTCSFTTSLKLQSHLSRSIHYVHYYYYYKLMTNYILTCTNIYFRLSLLINCIVAIVSLVYKTRHEDLIYNYCLGFTGFCKFCHLYTHLFWGVTIEDETSDREWVSVLVLSMIELYYDNKYEVDYVGVQCNKIWIA